MFDEIIEKIKASDYGEAKKSLLQIVSNGSPKDIAYLKKFFWISFEALRYYWELGRIMSAGKLYSNE